jgi:exodeoxyribonuclease-1
MRKNREQLAMTQPSIFWHDYETWGANPQKDLPCQFAGVRTDMDMNIIDKPLMIYSQIPSDYLPVPEACLITGITPQLTLRDGMVEADFIHKIHQQFSKANTCVAGYNNIRFDDEISRYTLYRNFYEPYGREWQQGNSRWDIIDMMRACYALRPEGIKWPINDKGLPSFKLQDLTAANDIQHQDAHDAMSDVYATIAVAKLIKNAQAKLFSFLFNLRFKAKVAELIDLNNMTPLVHVSSKISAEQGCCTWITPICMHPDNKNAVIVLNLALSPEPLLSMSAQELVEKLYRPNAMLAEGEQRLPIKLIHLNKCPVIAPAKTLTEENASRLGIDRAQCLQNLTLIKQHPEIKQKLLKMYTRTEQRKELDPEHALYSGGFFSDTDRKLIDQVRNANEQELTELSLPFNDPRLTTLLFRYKARNYPQTLNAAEVDRWQQYRKFRLLEADSPASIKLPEYLQQLEDLSNLHRQNPQKLAILKALYNYAQDL